MPKDTIINLHISFLPWNKGAHPNIWSFLEDTPKGVTIHTIDKGIDTGKILLQKRVPIDENYHTFKTSYELLHSEIQNLFKKNWNALKEMKIKTKPQQGQGSIHYEKDFDKIKDLLGDKGWDYNIKEFKKVFRSKYENK
jgi:methionyl-tRNA formyltransferase